MPRALWCASAGIRLATRVRMRNSGKLLLEATQHGYVIRRPGDPLVWKLFYAWCLTHTHPFVYIDLPGGGKTRTGAIVGIDLFTTSHAGHECDRFPPEALGEATRLIEHYPRVTMGRCPTPHTITSLAIRHANVAVEQAEELARR